ncbi:YqhG family protein [Halalkalibacter alkalisediminis]|uniref:YqhG family protein n=1 Tax=Halalkalibacter alkalisediminis TaxID=935616 RepID=A0ABV6NLJ6_9BACI|nr:YqhG family protein [Halalkalibacter alkalisediminis]
MQQPQVHNFLERYFEANDSPITENHSGYLQVQLSIELDKLLMNRPFYWHYLEKTGGEPRPMQVTFITDQTQVPEDIRGEQIHFGSPRLRQLFDSTKELGGFIRLFERIDASGNKSIPLQPWLCLNAKVSFQCDRKKDVLLSLGLNLIHGQIVPQFYERIRRKDLTPNIPDYCFKLSPLITANSGLIRLQKMVQTYAENEDETWAVEAVQRWEADQKLLEAFYEDEEEKPESYHVEKQALKEQYEPNIHVSIVNGGMFYLQQQVF